MDLKAKITAHVDATMPGRRIGSEPPEDCTEAAATVLQRLYHLLLDRLGMTRLKLFLAFHGDRSDDHFAVEFRRQAIREVLRNEGRHGDVNGAG